MPTYDYRCDSCDHELEIFQSMSESPKRKCPACGRLKLRRMIGNGAGIIFKGSGFYQTDYRSKSYQQGAESAKKERESATSPPADAAKKDAAKSKDAPAGDKKA